MEFNLGKKYLQWFVLFEFIQILSFFVDEFGIESTGSFAEDVIVSIIIALVVALFVTTLQKVAFEIHKKMFSSQKILDSFSEEQGAIAVTETHPPLIVEKRRIWKGYLALVIVNYMMMLILLNVSRENLELDNVYYRVLSVLYPLWSALNLLAIFVFVRKKMGYKIVLPVIIFLVSSLYFIAFIFALLGVLATYQVGMIEILLLCIAVYLITD